MPALKRTRKRAADASEDSELLSIGALARATGVSQRTIRYYEELGILPAPPRSEGGTRRYPADYKFYIEGARLLKDLGFTLDELKLVGRLALGAPQTKKQRSKALAVIGDHMQGLEHRMHALSRLHELCESKCEPSGGELSAASSMAELLALSD